jgi:hypothetical protein
LGIVYRKAKTIAHLGVELHVVIEDRAGFVEARRKLDVAIIINVGCDGDCT